jgi:thiol-disulfide isomerase/thioredoxin
MLCSPKPGYEYWRQGGSPRVAKQVFAHLPIFPPWCITNGVNRWFCSLVFALISVVTLEAAPARFDKLTIGSKTYKKVTVIGSNSTDLYFSHSTGIANIKMRLLSPELQKQFGYDPEEAMETERTQARDDQAYYDLLHKELSDTAQRRLRVAREDAQSSDKSIADPISDRSLISRASPKLETARWSGEKPVTAGKNVLLFCWTTWSQPVAKAVPELNALQKKFADSLVVVGLCSQDEVDLNRYAGPPMEFATALDPDGKITNLLGATSVPFVLLVDKKGTVLYQGHPGALTMEKVEKILPQTEDPK